MYNSWRGLTMILGLLYLVSISSYGAAQGEDLRITAIRWTNDRTRIATATSNLSTDMTTISIQNADTGIIVDTFDLNSSLINYLSWNLNGTKLAGAGYRGFFVYDVSSEDSAFYLDMDEPFLDAIAWLNDTTLVTGSSGISSSFTRKFWSATDGSLLAAYEGGGTIGSIEISPNGNYVAMGIIDGSIRIYSLDMNELLLYGSILTSEANEISRGLSLDWNEDGTRLISGFENGYIAVWNTENLSSINSPTQISQSILVQATENPTPGFDTRPVRAVTFSESGDGIATITADGTIRVWDSNGNLISTEQAETPVTAAAFSPDGSTLAFSDDGDIEQSAIFADLAGQLTLQVQATGSSNYALPLTVKLVQDETVTNIYTPNTDAAGEFIIEDIPQGTYDIWVKHDKGLAVMPEVELDVASVPFDFGTILMGDANNDNVIGLTDFSLLSSSYGKSVGQPGYDARADFNGDNAITLPDYSLLAGNFDLFGVPDPEPSGARIAPLASGTVDLTLNPDVNTVAVGQEFDVTVRVEAGDQPVDGAAAVLTFDPALLEVVSITPGASLPVALVNGYDNAEGEVRYAAGALEAFPSGTFDLVTVRFRALAVTESTGISFVSDGATGVTYAGESVLNATEPASASINDPTM